MKQWNDGYVEYAIPNERTFWNKVFINVLKRPIPCHRPNEQIMFATAATAICHAHCAFICRIYFRIRSIHVDLPLQHRNARVSMCITVNYNLAGSVLRAIRSREEDEPQENSASKLAKDECRMVKKRKMRLSTEHIKHLLTSKRNIICIVRIITMHDPTDHFVL